MSLSSLKKITLPVLFSGLITTLPIVHAQTSVIRNIQVTQEGTNYRVKADGFVAASPALAFKIFTDYNRQTSFIPNLVSSKIISQQGNQLTLEQITQVKVGPFVKKAYALKNISLDPSTYTITAQSLPQSDVQSSSMLSFSAAPGGALLNYELLATPPSWAPPSIFEATARTQAQEQLQGLFNEISRQQQQR